MQVSLHNKVKTFNLTAGKSLPEWLADRQKDKRKASESRIELIHDLEFPHSTRCMWRCPNGSHLFAAGDYPYRLKCFDVSELSMKYSFNADMNIMSGVCLSPDYRKFALRGEGREITIHHSATIVDRLRVPHAQRSLEYNRFNAELLSSGASPEIHRINLETGAFMQSYTTQSAAGVNSLAVFSRGPVSGVVLSGGCDGRMEAWDSRAGTCAAAISTNSEGSEVRHVSVDEAGSMLFACGLASGVVMLYDIRLNKPMIVKDHMNGLPIVKTYFFQGRSAATGEASFLLSADTRSVKVWSKNDGANFTSIEAPADISDFCVLRSQHNLVDPYQCDDSGVIAICCDTPRVQVHFIPQLGVAPRWAAFLENLTEELEEKNLTTVYDDYTFISKDELDQLGISADDMVQGKIRPAMHGAFIENSLYRQLKAAVDPSGFNRYINERAQEKKRARMDGRISRFKRVGGEDAEKGGASALAEAKKDPRFAQAFDSTAAPNYKLDRSNPEYAKLLTTIEERRKKAGERRQRYDSSLFSIVPDTEGDAGDTPVSTAAPGGRTRESPGDAKFAMYEVKADQGNAFERNDKSIHEARKKRRLDRLSLDEQLRKRQSTR